MADRRLRIYVHGRGRAVRLQRRRDATEKNDCRGGVRGGAMTQSTRYRQSGVEYADKGREEIILEKHSNNDKNTWQRSRCRERGRRRRGIIWRETD